MRRRAAALVVAEVLLMALLVPMLRAEAATGTAPAALLWAKALYLVGFPLIGLLLVGASVVTRLADPESESRLR